MKRYLPLLLAVFFLAAPFAHAAGLPLFSSDFHIVPDAHDIDPLCPVGAPLSFGAVLELIQRAMNVGVSVGIVAFTLIFMWSGILLMTSSTNPEAKSTARKMLGNAVLGMLIILSSWLIVDFVMKTLYNPSASFSGKAIGPWNSILQGGGACVIARPPKALFSGSLTAAAPTVNPTDPGGTGPVTSDNIFSYDPGIQSQKSTASSELNTLLGCIAGKVPAGVGRISSISDNKISGGQKTFAQCAAEGNQAVGGTCAHTKNSCHYGGKTCVGKSYAADFGDDQNASVLRAAAIACGADFTGFEGTHLHVSVGKACGCQ